MVRVALLIGVSRYPPGLDPLLPAHKDVEIMRRVLKQAQPGFESILCLQDKPRSTIEETIEEVFKQGTTADLILFVFFGYLLHDADKLYFATPETTCDRQGKPNQSKIISTQFVKDLMDASAARQQVVVLDGYIRQTFSGQAPASDIPVDLSTHLGGNGRVILAASAMTNHTPAPVELDVWSYSRYLAEGIETAAATDNQGILTAAAWHHYASRKLQRAAPAKQPHIYGTDESKNLPLFWVPAHLPTVRYRKLLEEKAETAEVDATGTMLLHERSLLDIIRQELALSSYAAQAIEAQTLRPIRDYRQRLQAYQEQLSRITQGQDAPTEQNPQYLKETQQALCLTDQDTAAIDAVPRVIEQQRQREQYQTNLAHYERILLAAMQHQVPLTSSDRQTMQQLQQILGLADADVIEAEQRLHEQIASPGDRQPSPPQPPPASNPSPPPNPVQNAVQSPARPPVTPTQPASPAPNPPPTRQPIPDAAKPPEMQANARPGQEVPGSSGMPPAPPKDPAPMNGVEKKISAPAPRRSYTALIIPGLLLAALVGSLIAVGSSLRLPTPFGNQTTQPTEEAPPAPSTLTQAAEHINLGVKAQEVGTDGAIEDFSKAIELMAKECVPATNAGSTQCQVLARAHSNRSYAYFQQQNFAKALEDANVAVTLDANLAEARINLANARFKQNELQAAIQDYDQALRLNPSNPLRAGIYNNRGNVLFSQKKAEAALKDYNEAIQLNQNYADAYFNRALAYETLANQTSAISDFQQAARLYQNRNVKLAEEAARRAKQLQEKGVPQTPLPPASASSQ